MIALSEEEAGFMRQNRKIDAIKCVRARTFMGLVEAKRYVEAWDGKAILTKEIEEQNRVEADLRLHLLGLVTEMEAGRLGIYEGLQRLREALSKPQ